MHFLPVELSRIPWCENSTLLSTRDNESLELVEDEIHGQTHRKIM